ncbi:MAG: hypothetical protein GTO22_27635 [Gemmatimonadales bacterium]|nr:hypothetical protein [Gemmatimonadales bacterium]
MKQIYVARDRADAELLKSVLASEGIRAVVRADPVPVTSQPYPSVWVVDDEEFERAKDLAADFARKKSDSE